MVLGALRKTERTILIEVGLIYASIGRSGRWIATAVRSVVDGLDP